MISFKLYLFLFLLTFICRLTLIISFSSKELFISDSEINSFLFEFLLLNFSSCNFGIFFNELFVVDIGCFLL